MPIDMELLVGLLPISLADYLDYPEPRLVPKYDSKPMMYPTDQTRRIVQGIVTPVVNFIAAKKKQHGGYLKNPKNYILSKIDYHPYADFVRDFALSHPNRKIIEDAGAGYPYRVTITLLKEEEDKEDEEENFDDDDDMKALEYMIFEVLLKLDDQDSCLPDEWQSFRELFSKGRSSYNLGLISSYPCLWEFKKRLDFYETLDRWCNDPHGGPVIETLAPLPIFNTIWSLRMRNHYFLKNFVGDDIIASDDDHKDVKKLVRVFTNIARDSFESCLPNSPFTDNEYLDYILRRLYPNLLEGFYEQTLGIGLLF